MTYSTPPNQPPAAYPAPPTPPVKKKAGVGKTLLLIGLGLAVLCCVGGVLMAALNPSVKKAASDGYNQGRSEAAGPATTQAAAAATTAAAKPVGPQTSITRDGTYLVGTDVAPGTYKATVPTSSSGCYWERESGLGGKFGDIISNENVNPGGQALVTIDASDKGFKTEGCGTWMKVA